MKTEDRQPAQTEELVAVALELLPEEVVVVDRLGRIVSVNGRWPRFAAENGAPTVVREGVGLDYLEVCERASRTSSPLAMEAFVGLSALLNGSRVEFQLEYPCHSAELQRWFVMHAVPFPPLGGLLITHVDITERKKQELMLWDAAQHDPLTGVLNRRGIAELAERLQTGGAARPFPLVVVVDIDGLKAINDRFGHSAGDMVIKAAARALRANGAAIARLGGDELLAILPRNEARYRLAYFKRVDAAFRRECGDIPASLTHGFARMPEDGDTLEQLIEVADRRMYEARSVRDPSGAAF